MTENKNSKQKRSDRTYALKGFGHCDLEFEIYL